MSGTSGTRQWLRKASLIASRGDKGIDLSNLRFRFEISQSDGQTPNTAFIRVYNVAPSTEKILLNEFDRVTVQAGYQEGAFGIVFDGTIKQTRHGKETNVDTYVDFLAADGDLSSLYGMVNQTLAPGASQSDVVGAAGQGMQAVDPNVSVDSQSQSAAGAAGGILPRGKVLYGLGLDYLRGVGKTTGTTWSVQNGVVTAVPLTGYLPNEVVIINSQTGMIGMPETTQNGVTAKVLLNPKVKVGTRVQINNKDINQTIVREQGFPTYDGIQLFASEAADGIYRVLVAEHEGDTRGNPWYTNIVCLAIDPSAQPASSIPMFPGGGAAGLG